jgi:prefoldin subunit 5
MPCPHNEITIVQRSQRQSAVAAAAYQSGEKLFCEYDQQVKHYPEKRGIVHNEILLPANAPPEYADRNTLWNAAEAVEKQWNSQLARRWVLTIPREIPPDQYAVLVREFCEQQFVSKGMIVDFAIHDPHPPGHNPHAHVLLTMRAMDEHGKWLPKSRKVYDLDESGERIKLPSGRWKSHKEDTVDWNDQKYCEIWRHEWEVIQNRYLEANDRPERVDLRSYARQGLDIVPTVHEGAAVQQMEKRGIQTNIGNLNREIKAANRLMQSIRQLIQNLKGWITELGEKRKELLAQKTAEEATLLPNLLMKYMEIRKEERRDWTRAGQNRGTSQDLKAVSEALSYLRQKGLFTVEDLEAFLEASGKSAADYRNQMKPKEARSKVIDGILASRTDCKECKAVYEKYQKIFFKKTKEKFKQEHPEVARYEKAAAYLAKHPDDKDSTQKELQEEQETLLSEIAELKVPLTEVQEDLKKLRDIRYWVRKATPGTEESKEPPKKQPIKEVLQDKADEKKAQRTAPAQAKHRQQDIILSPCPKQVEIIGKDTGAAVLCFLKLFLLGFLPGLGLFYLSRRLPVLIGNSKVLCQLYGGFFLSQPIQSGGKINHIPIRTAAEAVVTPIQLHAWGFIVMERATSHPVPTYMDSIMLRSLSCCDGLLHSFKYIQIYPSLKIRKAPDIL